MAKLVAAHEYTDAEMLALWREAYLKVSVHGQEYEIQGRKFTAANLVEIQQQITWLEKRVSAAANGLAVNYVERGKRL